MENQNGFIEVHPADLEGVGGDFVERTGQRDVEVHPADLEGVGGDVVERTGQRDALHELAVGKSESAGTFTRGRVYTYVYGQEDGIDVDKQRSDRMERGESATSSGSNHKGKLRLVLEMNIRTKPVISEGLVTPEPDIPNSVGDQQHEPISVTVVYPEDLMVTLNAQVQRLDENVKSRNNSQEELDESIGRGWKQSGKGVVNMASTNATTVLNSTFIKPPLTSTLIYPILEETETAIKNENINLMVDSSPNTPNTRKIGSEENSIYNTVMGDNEFGNLSAIFKAEAANDEKALQEEVDFRKDPSLTLNSKSKISQAEYLTPAEKLLQALHIMARYRGVWGIYEDETRIVKHLIRLNDLLTITDSETVLNTCRDEEYQEVKGLVLYFVLEKRFVIRSQLLHTFSLLSQKSDELGTVILASDIPVVLAGEIAVGDYASRETQDFALCFLQFIASRRLSRGQCERIGDKFYYHLIEMMHCAQKHYHGRISEMLFDILLTYHEQLPEQKDMKWKSLYHSVSGNRPAMLKIKQKLINYILKNGTTIMDSSFSSSSHKASSSSHAFISGEDFQSSGQADKKIKQILGILNDWIVCSATRGLFNDAELDILLVSLTHILENKRLVGVQFEAVKLMHRILRNIQTEPSGMEKMLRLVERLIMTIETVDEDDYERLYRAILKKIYRILTME